MNPEKKWRRYTQVGAVWVNMTKYRTMIQPADNGCLNYNGPLHRQGYRMIGVLDAAGRRKMTVAHRVAMRIKLNREITTNEDVRHSCGNNSCVNPAHLYIRNDEEANEQTATKISTFAS
jgi:hypothetical protein